VTEFPVRAVVFSLGSNVGDSDATLQRAVDALAATPGLTLTGVSSVYLTDPVDKLDQPDFHNIVVVGTSSLAPLKLLRRAHQIEDDEGRTRLVDKGPRTLDIDLIALDDLRCDTERLTVPHPRAHQRAFVLVPWIQLQPEARLPQGSAADLLAQIGAHGVRRIGDRVRLHTTIGRTDPIEAV